MADGKTFTDEEIAEIMKLLDATRRTQYIGARYVPIFGRKGETSIEWDGTAPYEPLTIVLHQGNSYTSRQYVPAGVEITNGQYWANTGNYNAQIEQYRREVATFDGRITENTATASEALTLARTNETAIQRQEGEISAIDGRITENTTTASEALTLAQTNETAIQKQGGEISTIKTTLPTLQPKDTRDIMVVLGDSMGVAPDIPEQTWHYKLAAKLGLTDKTYCVGGVGFIRSNGYAAQAARAALDTSYDHDDVKYVFINGSTNDYVDPNNSISDAVANVTTTLRKSFPKAQFIAFDALYFFNVRYVKNGVSPRERPQDYQNVFQQTRQALYNNGWTVIASSEWFRLCIPQLTADELHPTDQGTSLLANIVYGFLTNHIVPPSKPLFVSPKNVAFIINNDTTLDTLPEGLPKGIDLATFKALFSNYKNDWASYTIMPDNNSVSIVAKGTMTFSKETFTKFKKNYNGDKLYSVDIPILIKPYPVQQISAVNTLTTWNVPTLSIGGQPTYNTTIDFTRKTDDRLDNPASAEQYIYVSFDYITDPSTSSTQNVKMFDNSTLQNITINYQLEFIYPLNSLYV